MTSSIVKPSEAPMNLLALAKCDEASEFAPPRRSTPFCWIRAFTRLYLFTFYVGKWCLSFDCDPHAQVAGIV